MQCRGSVALFTAAIVNVYVTAAIVPLSAQVRTTGQIVGTVRDASGAVVPNAELVLQDAGTGLVLNGRTDKEGGFTFPNLQPGRYRLTAVFQGFQPVSVEDIVVETARTANLSVAFEVAGVTERVQVEGRAPVIETTSSTVSTTVRNAEIAKLPLNGRNILNFALLTPGTATSSTERFSTFNGLPGGAINLTLDGINNNSQRFRSGGTSFFTFAPVRLGAIEEVTVSTAGLTADAGAEGAVQVQFVTKRGTNDLHWQVFDQFRNDALNANSWLNSVRRLPKPKVRQNEYGANIGGPLKRGRLFYFANFEQIVAPGTSTQSRTVLTPEAQQGIFRYTAADNSVRTVDLLEIARANNLPSAIDPFIGGQFATMNPALGRGTVSASDLVRNTLSFVVPTNNRNVYPTGRIDWQASSTLAVRGILNLQWRDFTRNPQFPGLQDVNGGFESTYYILSTGADWTPRNNLFNQFSFGFQSNKEEFNPGNTLDLYGGFRRVPFPLQLTTVFPTNDVMPQPRNNPVFNIVDSITLLRGNHTYTMGGSFRRTTMWEQIGGNSAAGPTFSLGVAAGDPASSAFTAATIPGVRSTDLPTALSLYALLTGRISSISGTNNVDEITHEYNAGPVIRREAQNVGGLFVQDQWRLTSRFTLNYGLRWEFSGPAHNTNGIYTSPTLANLYGPSTALFRPGTLDGSLDPQIDLRPRPYRGDYMNPAPNAGFAWNPSRTAGMLRRLFGDGKSVIRGSVGLNYYDEGLIAFQSVAGGNPGLSQSITLNPGQPGFTPGGLLLSSNIPTLSTFPASFAFPLPQSLFTFTRGFNGVNPDIRTPSVLNWNIGLQRELWPGSAAEIRYVGNRGFHVWRAYDINEINVIENGFADEFVRAQRNLAINVANGRTGFANNNLPGQSALPIFDAAFGPRGGQPALPAASGYTNGAFITLLQQGQAGGLAQQLAANSLYMCRLVGSSLSPCTGLGYNAAGPYPINVFQANPFASGRAITLLNDDGWSRYNGLQLQFRQRYGRTMTVTANYTYSHARSNRYSDSPAASVALFTNRDDTLNDVPHIFDLRHAFQTYWTYELPFGRDRRFAIDNAIANQILGGWALSGIARVQSGRPFFLTSGRNTFNNFENGVVLAPGVTVDQLQDLVGVFPGPNGTKLFFDPSLIGADGRASPQFLLSPTTPGERGQRIFLYGPGYWNVDLGIAKRFSTPGRMYVNFEALFLDLFNRNNFLVGGASSDSGFGVSINGTTFGQTTSTTGGPRNVQLRLVIGF
jgi:hypothetical protein